MDRMSGRRCPNTTIDRCVSSKERRLASSMSTGRGAFVVAALLAAVGSVACGSRSPTNNQAQATPAVTAPATAPEMIRLSGTVEAVRSRAVIVPRLQGPLLPLLIIGLVPAGTRVEPGDVLVEFDPQQQERDAFDRRAEVVNLDGENRQEARRAVRRRSQGSDGGHRRRARRRAGAAGCAQERTHSTDRRGEEHAHAQPGHREVRAAEAHVRLQAQGCDRRDPDSRNPARTRRARAAVRGRQRQAHADDGAVRWAGRHQARVSQRQLRRRSPRATRCVRARQSSTSWTRP